jgi:multidrug resistance efflux pump
MDDTQARNLLTGAEAQMAQAEDALQRYGMLHDAGSLPEVQWVEIQSKVAQARSQLAVAKKNLADCRLVAPVSGIIGRQQVKAGETAVPSQAVVTILDVSRVKVKVSVPEAEMSAITPHTPSMIIVEAAGKKVSGGRIEKGVVADAMTFVDDHLVQLGIFAGIVAYHKEGCLDIISSQNLQYIGRRLGYGAVVEGQIYCPFLTVHTP